MNRHPVAVTSVTGMHASSASEPYSASQWEFQDPKMEVPTIYKAYFLGYVSEYHHKIWPKIWYSTSILGS